MTNPEELFAHKLGSIKEDGVHAYTKMMSLLGLSSFEARLFAILSMDERPMTLDEMSESMGMSKTSMSTGIRSLLDAQIVQKTWRRGVRKDLYVAEDNLFKAFDSTLLEPWLSIITHNQRDLTQNIEQLMLMKNETQDMHQLEILDRQLKKHRSLLDFYGWLLLKLKDLHHEVADQK